MRPHRLILTAGLALLVAVVATATRDAYVHDAWPVTVERLVGSVFITEDEAACYLDGLERAGISRGVFSVMLNDVGETGPVGDSFIAISDSKRAALTSIAVECSPFEVEVADAFDAMLGGDSPTKELAAADAGPGESAVVPRVNDTNDLRVIVALDGSTSVISAEELVIAVDPDAPIAASNR